MTKISFRIAYLFIFTGLFVVAAFITLDYQYFNTQAYMVVCLLVIYIFLFGVAAGQSFSRPIKKLVKRTSYLQEGNVKSKLSLKSDDELGELANLLNKISEELEKSKSKSEELEKTIDLRVKAKTVILEQIVKSLEQKVKNRTLEAHRAIQELEQLKMQLADNKKPLEDTQEGTPSKKTRTRPAA